jgi:hypothetical protein
MGFDILYVLSVAYSHTAGGDPAGFSAASLSDMFGPVKAPRGLMLGDFLLDSYKKIKHPMPS